MLIYYEYLKLSLLIKNENRDLLKTFKTLSLGITLFYTNNIYTENPDKKINNKFLIYLNKLDFKELDKVKVTLCSW